MGYGYSVDLRERVVDCIKRLNLTYAAGSEMFNVSVASVNRWLRLDREKDSLEPKPHAGGRTCGIKDGHQLQRFEAIVQSQADATIAEITRLYNLRTKRKVSRSAVSRALHRIGYTRKKRATSQVRL